MKRRRRRRYRKNQGFGRKLLLSIALISCAFIGIYAFAKSAAYKTNERKQEYENSPKNLEADSVADSAPAEQPEEQNDTSELPSQAGQAEHNAEAPEQEKQELTKEELLEQEIEAYLDKMTLEEKICQMFILTPEQLTGISPVTAAGETTKNRLMEYPVGGLIYFAQNLVSEEQTKEMLANTKEYAAEIGAPPLFFCIDEEGGRVARIGKNPAFQVEHVKPMGEITDEEEAYEAGVTIGRYLSELGFNTDFAPDADVMTNEQNTVIGDRSFGSDPQTVAHMAAAVSDGLHKEGILSAFKHFPGHGATKGDTHDGYAYTERTYEELRAAELVPFEEARECGADMVMAAHISLPNVLGDNTPATLSYRMITEILREDLGFQGLVVTDALNMGAISENYSSKEAAVKAVESGVDLLLMPKDFLEAYEGIREAVSGGRISEERISESVRRILHTKLFMEQ